MTSSKGGRAELMQLLEKLEIRSQVVEHPAVFTVEEMMPHVGHLVGAHSKNLFLRDKKKKGLWLVTTLAEREVNLGDLGKKLSVSGGLRFADEDVMIDTLNVAQGRDSRVLVKVWRESTHARTHARTHHTHTHTHTHTF